MGDGKGVVVASIMRNSAHYVERYFQQLEALSDAGGLDVTLVIGEGDSSDDTYALIQDWLGPDDIFLKVDHGGPSFGSIDHPQRWKQIAFCCNAVMNAVPPDQPVIYVEADLVWKPATMLRLLDDLEKCDAVAPLSLRHGVFYDLWGHRGLDGEHFHAHAPYHLDLDNALELVRIGSAGSCVVMRPEIAKVARFSETDCIVGLGRSIREHGDLWIDKTVAVYHP